MQKTKKPMLSRDKPLSEMSIDELVWWLRDLCNDWYQHRCDISTGIVQVEEEMLRTMKELSEAFKGN